MAVSCMRCGVGSLISGIDADEALPAAIVRWLEDRGWSTGTNPVCGDHI
ncbi:hypothetical protein [Rhodococcus indonesiensis]